MKRYLTLLLLLCSTFLGFSQQRKPYKAPLWDVYITDAEPGTEFYLLDECTEVMIENRQLKQSVLNPNGEKYKLIAYHKLSNHKQKYPVYREIRGQEGAFKGAYYPADSLLLSRMDSTERAYIISELQCKGRYEEEPVGFMARVSAGLDPKSKKDIQKTAEFFDHYFKNVTETTGTYSAGGFTFSGRILKPEGHHFGSEFIEIEDSQKQIHYIPVYKTYSDGSSLKYEKVSLGQFIESNYYDWLQDTFVGKEICLMGSSICDYPPYSTFDFIGIENVYGNTGKQEYIKIAYKCVGFKLEQDSDDIAVKIENDSFSTPHLKRYSESTYDIGDLTNFSKTETLMEIAVANCMLTTSGDFITSDAFDAISKGLDVLRDEYQAKEAEKQRLKEVELAEIKAREAKEKTERKKSFIDKYGEHYGALLVEGQIEIGMTVEMCKEALFITRIKSEQTEYQTAEIWKEYFGSKYLVFVDGKLVKITEY